VPAPVPTTLGAILAAVVATVLTIDEVTELVSDELAGLVAGTVDDTDGFVTLSGVDAADAFADSTAPEGFLGNELLALLFTFTSTP
jgi:hypothetical protein